MQHRILVKLVQALDYSSCIKMTKGVQWIKEKGSTTLCLPSPNPIMLGTLPEPAGQILPHPAFPKNPTKYRRYPLTGDCYRKGAYDCVGRLEAPFSLRSSHRPTKADYCRVVMLSGCPGSIPDFAPFTVAVPIGRCFSQFDLLKPDWMVPR